MNETLTFIQQTYVERNYIVSTKLGYFYIQYQNIMSLIFAGTVFIFLFYMMWNLTRDFK